MPPSNDKLKKGDKVHVLYPLDVRGLTGQNCVVEQLYTSSKPYWELSNEETGYTFIVAVPIVMKSVE